MAHSLPPPLVANLAGATVVVDHLVPEASRQVEETTHFAQFSAWINLRDNPPPGPLDISFEMHEIENTVADPSNPAHRVDLLFQTLIEKIRNKYLPLLTSDQQLIIHLHNLSILQNSLQQHYENADLETIWNKLLYDELQCLDAFERIDPPTSHQEIRAWLNSPENARFIQQIDHLDLSDLNLHVLPAEIGLFTGLIILKINENHIRSLPPSIGNLRQLRQLHACYNSLESLPSSIENLTMLEVVDLTFNSIKQVPASLCSLPSLKRLELCENQLKFLPDELGRLSNLEFLDVSSNDLQTMPQSIKDLHRLIYLNASNNLLSVLPCTITQLQLLEWLELSGNYFQQFPREICSLSQLKVLGMENNQLAILPRSLFAMPQLTGAYFADNPIAFMTDDDLSSYIKPCWTEEFELDRSFQEMKSLYEEFSNYSCKTPFARLLQIIACELSKDEIIASFFALELSTKKMIINKIYELRNVSTLHTSIERYSYISRDLLAEFLEEAFLERLESLTLDQQVAYAAKVSELYRTEKGIAGPLDQLETQKAFSNMLRLYDSIDLILRSCVKT